MNVSEWLQREIPDLSGKTIIVTGGNSGIGYEAVRLFAKQHAHVVLTSRNEERGHTAAEAIRSEIPDASIDVMHLDLADLDSVKSFADTARQTYDRIDILCNNAGVMALPYRKNKHGFEMQFATNHLGHFALTGHLMPTLLQNPTARIVTVSSSAHQIGKIQFDNLHWEFKYNRWRAYGQSKIANLLFTYELQRRLEAAGSSVMAVAAHPGWAATNLQTAGPKLENATLKIKLYDSLNRWFGQSAEMGALPTVFAAASESIQGGQYVGPAGFNEARGFPKITKSNDYSYDKEVAERLWSVSEELTGVRFQLEKAHAQKSVV